MNSSASHTDPAIELRAEVERLKVENSLLRGTIGDLRQRISELAYSIVQALPPAVQLEKPPEE